MHFLILVRTAPLINRIRLLGLFYDIFKSVLPRLFVTSCTQSPDLYFTSWTGGKGGQTISAWSWLPLIILAVHSILFVLIFWNMTRPDSKLCQVPRKSHASGRPSCFSWKMAMAAAAGGEVCFRKTISLLHCQTRRRWGVTRRIGTYIKRTAKQLSVFLLISSEYCCWTRPGEVPGLHFSCNTIQVQNLTACSCRGGFFL